MVSAKLANLYKTIIMEHSKNPRNKGVSNQKDYISVHLKNPTCGDDIEISIKLNNGNLEDIRHQGTGCAICCSSASVMSIVLKNKSIDDANLIINGFYQIVQGNDISQEITMGDAIAYAGVSKFPARIKCATIPWKAIEQAILEGGNNL